MGYSSIVKVFEEVILRIKLARQRFIMLIMNQSTTSWAFIAGKMWSIDIDFEAPRRRISSIMLRTMIPSYASGCCHAATKQWT